MDFRLGNSVVNSYKRLSYTPWYAFAEFVDNSTQAYFNHKEAMDKILAQNGRTLTINIDYVPEENLIRIRDNSFGMDAKMLENALVVGVPPEDDSGRSKYGLGMKTAAFWFGDEWKIITSKLGDSEQHEVIIKISDILNNKVGTPTPLTHNVSPVDSDEHGTVIEITNLNRSLKGRTLSKIKDYLSSMYRIDFNEYGLKIFWQGDLLAWDDFDERLYITEDGKSFKQEIDFKLENGKAVKGWVGVLGKGNAGRKHAGFSIIKANRVIEGWPRAYKPNSIFGDLDDGVNDLVNQRIVGELFLDDFEVSHTKDSIIWLEDEETELDDKLGEACTDAVYLAKTARFKTDGINQENAVRNEAISIFESEVNSSEFKNFLISAQPPEEKLLELSYKRFGQESREGRDPNIDVEVGVDNSKIHVQVFFVENSEFDPYVVIEASATANNVIVIINAAHPFYVELDTAPQVTNFIRQCVYDGVAEWKAIKLLGEIQPYTIKNLKDGLLRVPFLIKQHKYK